MINNRGKDIKLKDCVKVCGFGSIWLALIHTIYINDDQNDMNQENQALPKFLSFQSSLQFDLDMQIERIKTHQDQRTMAIQVNLKKKKEIKKKR